MKDGDENQTVRDSLMAAMEKHDVSEKEVEAVEVEAPAETEVKEVAETNEIVENETGDEQATEVEEPKEAVTQDKKPPQALSAGIKGKWSDIPDDVKNEFIRLEQASAKGVASLKDDAHMGRNLMKEIEPYKALIASAGGTPETAVRNLFQTAAILRTGTPQQKQNAVLGIMQEYGINLNGQEPARIDPYMQEINNLKQQLEQQQQARQTQEESQVLTTIDSFLNETDDKGNPKYPLDESLEAELVGEITAVRRLNPNETDRKVLELAYERMSWKVPAIRETLLQRRIAEEATKRKEKSAQEVAKKQNAGVSIKGTSAAIANQGDIPLRELISKQIYGTDKRI